jgi:hypothetical protein
VPFQILYVINDKTPERATASCTASEPEVDAVAMGMTEKVGWIYVHSFKVHLSVHRIL